MDNLESRLAAALAAQKGAKETKKPSEPPDAMVTKKAAPADYSKPLKITEDEVAQAGVRAKVKSSLRERAIPLVQAEGARKEHQRILGLIQTAETAVTESGVASPEMTAFLEDARARAEAQLQREQQLMAAVESADTDPNIKAALQYEAQQRNEIRRLNLSEKYYKYTGNIRSKLTGNQGPHREQYRKYIGGNAQYDTATILEMFAAEQTGEWTDKHPSVEDAKDAVGRLEIISSEADKIKPDMLKIDSEFSGFFLRRLEHFAATMSQRVALAAEHLFNYYEAHPSKDVPNSRDYWIKNLTDRMPNPQHFINEARSIMASGDQNFRARALQQLGQKWESSARIAGTIEAFPFIIDNFEEPAT